MEPQPDEGTLCWTKTNGKPCEMSTCPNFIKFTEADNCFHRIDRTLTKSETARALDISRQRVGEIERTALGKMRDRLVAALSTDLPDTPITWGEPQPVVPIARAVVDNYPLFNLSV